MLKHAEVGLNRFVNFDKAKTEKPFVRENFKQSLNKCFFVLIGNSLRFNYIVIPIRLYSTLIITDYN